jgi:hypothetical protein
LAATTTGNHGAFGLLTSLDGTSRPLPGFRDQSGREWRLPVCTLWPGRLW